MTMVEKVAQALAESMNGGEFNSPKFYNGEQREVWMSHARAAMAAMREPTWQMRDRAMHLVEGETSVLASESTKLAWQIMIDAAIGENG